MVKILALSSSRVGSSAYLEKAAPMIKDFLEVEHLNIAFVPFASAENGYRNYLKNVTDALEDSGHVINLVDHQNAKAVVRSADVIMIGGGNTFKLLHDIYAAGIIDLIKEKVKSGTPYIGWSAGTNITCPGIYTTNDMPVLEPSSFKAFHFFPFQINPHYYNQPLEGFNGETRDQRLMEFIAVNPGVPVLGLPEGTALTRIDNKLTLMGECSAVLFAPSKNDAPEKLEIEAGSDLSYLMKA